METIQGRGMSPALVLWHVERLPDTSLTHALRRGGWEHFGWGQDRHLFADLYDALTFNTRATGHWGKKPPEFPLWPRPVTEQPEAADSSEAKAKKFSVKNLWLKWNALGSTQSQN